MFESGAGVRAFAERGYRGLSMRQVAEALDVLAALSPTAPWDERVLAQLEALRTSLRARRRTGAARGHPPAAEPVRSSRSTGR